MISIVSSTTCSRSSKKRDSGSGGLAAFKTLLTEIMSHFDRTLRGAALVTLQSFGVPPGTTYLDYLRAFRVVIATTEEKGGPWSPSTEVTMELVRAAVPMVDVNAFPWSASRKRQAIHLSDFHVDNIIGT